jgi:hypothetical protein
MITLIATMKIKEGKKDFSRAIAPLLEGKAEIALLEELIAL